MGSLSRHENTWRAARWRWTLGAALLGLAASALAAGEAWKTKPPAEWTQEEALAVLTNSPWAQRVTLLQWSGRTLARLPDGRTVVYREAPDLPPRQYSVEPVSTELEFLRAVYAVRWSSSATVAQALGRLRELAPVLAEMQAAAPELSPEQVVLTVRVVEPPAESSAEKLSRPAVILDESNRAVPDRPPVVADIFAGLSEEELRRRAELVTSRKLRLKSERALRHGLGTSEGISFFFPRQLEGKAALPPGTEWAEFVFTGVKKDKLKVRFKLGEMRSDGQPDY